jgi:AcrR family transcriptional regulator
MVVMDQPKTAANARPAKRKFNEKKWREILDAAATTFAAKGYDATTIRDIADAVGMLGGSLYYYIDTKEDLLYALIDDFHRMGMEEVEDAEQEAAAAGHADDPLATLRAVCIRHAEVNVRSRTLSAVFYNDFRHLDAERKQHIVESRRRHQHRIEELIAACQAAGEIRRDVQPRLTALAMLSLLNSTNTWYHPEMDTSSRSIGDFLAGLLIDGLAISPPPTTAPTGKTATRSAKTPASAATPTRKRRTTTTKDDAAVVPLKATSRRKAP